MSSYGRWCWDDSACVSTDELSCAETAFDNFNLTETQVKKTWSEHFSNKSETFAKINYNKTMLTFSPEKLKQKVKVKVDPMLIIERERETAARAEGVKQSEWNRFSSVLSSFIISIWGNCTSLEYFCCETREKSKHNARLHFIVKNLYLQITEKKKHFSKQLIFLISFLGFWKHSRAQRRDEDKEFVIVFNVPTPQRVSERITDPNISALTNFTSFLATNPL